MGRRVGEQQLRKVCTCHPAAPKSWEKGGEERGRSGEEGVPWGSYDWSPSPARGGVRSPGGSPDPALHGKQSSSKGSRYGNLVPSPIWHPPPGHPPLTIPAEAHRQGCQDSPPAPCPQLGWELPDMKGLGRGGGGGAGSPVARGSGRSNSVLLPDPGRQARPEAHRMGQGFPDDEEGFLRCVWESVPSSAGLPRLRLPPQSPTLTKGPLPFKARLSLLTQKSSQAPGGTFHNPAHQGQNSLLSWPLLRETSGPERLSSIPFHSSDRSGTGHPCNPRSKARSPGRVLGLC